MNLDELPVPDSIVTQDYLKAIYTIGEWGKDGASASELAARMKVGAPTVTETVQRLCAGGYVNYRPYRRVTLTDTGRLTALAMVRRHRLIETYLARALGYGWDEVHDDAERLEHAASPTLLTRIDAALGNPIQDPHGDPIPRLDGRVVTPRAHRLAEVAPGQRVRVVRISDTDPQILRDLAARGVGLGDVFEVRAGLPERLAEAMWVEAAN